eukprot:COSAG06_NODE_1775_length_8426_cov_4.369761_1_plen_65_part_10
MVIMDRAFISIGPFRSSGDLLIRVHSAFVELPQEAFRQVPLRGSSRPPSTCLCQVLFFLMRQVPF